MAKKKPAIWNHSDRSGSVEKIEVHVMAQADGYAMVRRKGCAPFVVLLKELEFTVT